MIVFTDNFTVSVDTNIDAYPSGSPDYAYVTGSGTNFTVNAANDRNQIVLTNTDIIARIIDGAVPTGDQQITCDVHNSTGADDTAALAARCASGSVDCYVAYPSAQAPNPHLNFYRVTTGGFTQIAGQDRTFGADASVRFKAVGTNPVDLEGQVDATAVVTFSDSAADRKQSGTPGLHGFATAANVAWHDNVSVDDLTTAVTPTPLRLARIWGAPLGRGLS